MSEQFFTNVHNMLREGETLNIKATRLADGQIKLLIQPLPGEAPDSADEDEQQARAALAEPLMVNRSAEELDGGFMTILTRFANQRLQLGGELEALERLREGAASAKKAQSKAEGKAGSGQSKASAEAGTAPEPSDGSAAAPGEGEAVASEEQASADSDSLV